MNLILLCKEDFISINRVRLQGRRYEHAREILKVTSGKILHVGLLGGKTGSGTVISITEKELELEVLLTHEPPEPLSVTVILAMPRPKVLNRVLQGITAMGIKQVFLLNTWRVDKSYWQSAALEPAAIQAQLILGLEQARDTILPEVQLQPRFKPFVEDILPTIAAGTCALAAHPVSSQPCPANVQQAVTLAIGPEGGFTTYEIEKLVAAGLTSIHLGNRPLRVETAVPALIGRLLPCS
ncbi:MAG: 16S rRNA (uracil(1498)-N(3))-methyltransferase [Desulfuromonadales bacterium]|nr:16S rRNA (uracil(1498)-N(3))-methyltransferase [Desulfuromonadales bacterium]